MKFTFAPESKPLEGFTIKRAIQRGGFGEVYYGLSDAGKEVALKLVQQNMEIEIRGVTQCLNLKHPNLVTIFDIRTDDDGDHWIVMEYVAGKSLDQVLAEYPDGMPLEDIRRWLSDITAGMNYLHDKGLVHRDLKPANIYSESDQIKIGDVGLSKFISPSRRSAHSQSVGTVYYMAPEVAHGRYGQEVDVYSLAIILFEMLTGRVPFDGETTAEILMKHLSEKPDLSAIPEKLRPVLARALEKDPQRRTSSTVELAREFHNAIGRQDSPSDQRSAAFTGNQSRSSTSHETVNGQTPCREQTSFGKYKAGSHVRSNTDRQQTNGRQGYGDACSPPHRWERDRSSRHRLVWWIVGIFMFFMLAVRTPLTQLFGPGLKLIVIVGSLGVLMYGMLRLFQFTSSAVAKILGLNPEHHQVAQDVSRGGATHTGSEPYIEGSERKLAKTVSYRKYGHPLLTPYSLRKIPMRFRMTELTGGMLSAVFCTVVMTTGLYSLTSFLVDPGAVGMFTITTLVSSWAILIPAKLWEGTRIDSGLRRLVYLLIGCFVGVLAFSVEQTLMVEFPSDQASRPIGVFASVGNRALLDETFQPTMAGYVIFFGALFSLRTWWRQVDIFRIKRFRILSLLMTLLVAYFVTLVWAFPQNWALTWAAAISSVVQLAAIWVPEEHRQACVEGHSDE